MRKGLIGLIGMIMAASVFGCGAPERPFIVFKEPDLGPGAIDGFVFVPTRDGHVTRARQEVVGMVGIPHALIQVFRLPRHPGDPPLKTGRADASGYYHITGLPLNVPLLVVAKDPFGLPTLKAVTTLDRPEPKRRDVTEKSTVAAAVVEELPEVPALSDDQVEELETVAEQVLTQAKQEDPTLDVLTDPEDLKQVAIQAKQESTGNLEVNSNPPGASITLNGQPTGRTTPYTFTDLPIGDVTILLRRGGYLDLTHIATVEGGKTTSVTLNLVPLPTPVNQAPVINNPQVRPPELRFEGGTVHLQAEIVDPNDDPLQVWAEVRLGTQRLPDVPLTKGVGNEYTGTWSVEGNETEVTMIYVIVIVANDGELETRTSELLLRVRPATMPPAPATF